MADTPRRFSLRDVVRKLNEAGGAVVPPAPPAGQRARPEESTPRESVAAPAEPVAPRPLPAPDVTRIQAAPSRPSPTSPDSGDEEPFDVMKYLAVIMRRWRMIAVLAVAGCAWATFSYLTAPRYYVAHARLLFSPGYQEIVNDFPGAWQGYINRERLLYTHLELLKSRAVAARLAETMGNVISPPAISGGLSIARGETDGTPNDIIEVSFQHPNAEMAREVANEFCRTYIDYRRDVSAQEQTRLVIKLEAQIERQQGDLQNKEDALRTFKERNTMVELSDETNTAVTQVAAMEAALQQTQLELVETRQRLESLRGKIGEQEANVVQSMTYDNTYQSRLADLELQLSSLSAEYSPEHYKVRMLNQQIDTLKKAMASDAASRVARQTTLVTNPIRQALLEDMVKLNISKAALDTRRSAQEQLINQLTGKLTQLPAVEQQYVTLQRETALLEETLKLLRREYEQAKIARESQESDLRIFELAQTPTNRISRQKLMTILAGLLVGLLLGIGLAFALEFLDQTVKDAAEAERILEAPLLGVVPHIDAAAVLGHQPSDMASAATEPFRAVRANLKHVMAQSGTRVLMLCSAVKGEGKTTLAANLAISFSLDGRRVALVDCDLRRPHIQHHFSIPREPGVTEYLHATASLDQILRPTGFANLSVIPVGATTQHPAELIGSPRLPALLSELRGRTDLVIVDSPAMLAVSDVITMAPLVDAIVMVVRTHWTPTKAARHAVAILRRMGTPILGGVVNGVQHSHGYSQYYGYYGKRYGYEDAPQTPSDRLTQAGMGLVSRARDTVSAARFALPRLLEQAGGTARSVGRRPLFWVLVGLLVALFTAERTLRPVKLENDYQDGIRIVEPARSLTPAPRQNRPVVETSAMVDRQTHWHNSLVRWDTLGALRMVSTEGLQWEDSSGTRDGRGAITASLSSAAFDSILVDGTVGWRDDPGQPACTVFASLRDTRADRTIRLRTVWAEDPDAQWRIRSQAVQSGVSP